MERLDKTQKLLLGYIQADLQCASIKIDKFLDRKLETHKYYDDLVRTQKIIDNTVEAIAVVIQNS